MKIRFNRIRTPIGFDSVSELYIATFPHEERRELSEIYQLISKGEIFIHQIIIAENKVAGFCIFWVFDEFAFIEHFAVFPELRNVGIGEGTLSLLQENYKVLTLETELPVDEISIRRIKFYERNGFNLLQQRYFQPSYGKNKPEIELKIMCTKADISDGKLVEYLLQIRKKVYGKIS